MPEPFGNPIPFRRMCEAENRSVRTVFRYFDSCSTPPGSIADGPEQRGGFVVGDQAAAEWSVDGGLLVIAAVPLALTAEGAEAFGTYPEGEPFDALTVTLDAGADCAAAALEARANQPGSVTLLVAVALTLAGAAAAGVVVARVRRTRAA